MITIVIPGPPTPQIRHKSARQGGYIRQYDPLSIIKHGIRMTVITPQLYEIAEQLKSKGNYKELDCEAYSVNLEFRMPVPRSDSKKRTIAKLDGSIAHASKPDIDNLIKFVLDLGNDLIWSDDSKIVEINAIKRYHKEPSTIINIKQYGKLNEVKT